MTRKYLSWQIDEVGNHPALLMWTLGNELPLNANNSALVATLNQRIQFARNYTLYKWNRFIPITVAVVDDPTSYHILESGMNWLLSHELDFESNSYNYLVGALDVDVFTTNAGYRGFTYSDLWSGNGQDFEGLYKLSCQYNKPVFIGEIGWHYLDNATAEFPNWFNQNWQDLVNHIDQGCIGGAFFDYPCL